MLPVVVVAVSIGFLSILLIVFVWRRCCYKQGKDFDDVSRGRPDQSLQAGIAQLHQESLHNRLDLDARRRGNYYVFRRGVSSKPLFNWVDHPSLITDAVENGWSRFGFTNYTSSPSARSSLLAGFCAVGDYGREPQTDISWEVCQGSADFMQKIRLNSGLNKANISNNPSMSAASVIRTALPLPGPPLGNSAFPQEAYFEITILYSHDDHESIGKVKEVYVTTSHRIININDELKLAADFPEAIRDRSDSIPTVLSILMILLFSQCFNSMYMNILSAQANGPKSRVISFLASKISHMFRSLSGIKLVFESEKTEWARVNKVIGCGFDPRQKKVFFTIDSELVHVINCKSEEFGTPLYPTLAANNDILVLVNFGQSAFTYAAANAQRTSNPCFIGPLVNSPAAALGYEDSKELFSMGRIDSQWLNSSSAKGGHNTGINNQTSDFDVESEADLFEIVLDSSGRSPNTVL
ncbi:hypothetical protein JRO89_XS07G0075900 [Xanthoceras sorbifolium]|uniref:Uncharacterized protein n=1 Tax=Xanthoceras sorbifolium TaxID=99658 RepID=A0ABQ8HT06_9ROSI|nr:hypothetical protein JRO89_XS07G0075900 [Xanthoceras sorbifolium]